MFPFERGLRSVFLVTPISIVLAWLAIEVGKAKTLTEVSMVHPPGGWDHLHAAGVDLGICVALGAVVFLWRIVAVFVGRTVAAQKTGCGAVRAYVLDFYEAVFAVGVPLVGCMMSVFEGTKYWQPHLHLWFALGAAIIVVCPVSLRLLRVLARAVERLRTRAPLVTMGLLLISALAASHFWYQGAQLFGYGYGHIHILAAMVLIFAFYVLVGFGLGDRASKDIRRRYLAIVPSLLVVASVWAILAPPSRATSELLFATLPTRWVLLSGEFTVDLDGDGIAGSNGVFAGRDCDDYDARRFPDQQEIVGNDFDENCFPGDQEVPIATYFHHNEIDYDPSQPTYNIVMFSMDGVRLDIIDDPRTQIPNMRRIAQNGLEFSNYRVCSAGTKDTLPDILYGNICNGTFIPEGDTALGAMTNSGVETFRVDSGTARFTNQAFGWSTIRVVEDTDRLHEDRDVVAEAIDGFLLTNPPEPFLLFMHLMGTHVPITYEWTCPDETDEWEQYRCSITHMDELVGQLLAALETAGLMERTVFIVTSDHGEGFHEHGQRYHGSNLYEELVRVPLLMQIPGITPDRIDEPANCYDLTATMVSAANMQLDSTFFGRDFTQLPRPADGMQFGRTRRSLRQGTAGGPIRSVVYRGIKLVFNDSIGSVAYYDLAADPDELNPLQEVDPELKYELDQRMEAWLSLLAVCEGY